MSQRPWKLLDLLDEASRFLTSKQIEKPRLQAELLLADVLDMGRLDLYLQFDRVLKASEVEAFRAHVRQRLRRVPLQYITGRAAFRHLDFAVSRTVLIPRPETEILVEIALEYIASLPAPRVLDLGCGAGVIAVCLAHEHPTTRVVATDISAEALQVTRQNALRNQVDERVAGVCGDLFAPLRPRPDLGRFDLIVSNPPYVRRGDIATLAPEVRDYEPHLALDGGEDGLVYYGRIANQAADFLEPGGSLVLEVGDGQADEVADRLRERFDAVEIRPDLNDIPRVVAGRKPVD